MRAFSCVNALERALLISTKNMQEVEFVGRDCVNALERALLISTAYMTNVSYVIVCVCQCP